MTKSIIHDVMPDWNGNESIVAYSIRKRNERKAHAHLVRMLTLVTFAPIGLATVVAVTAILCDYFLNTY